MEHIKLSGKTLNRITESLKNRYNNLSYSIERKEHFRDECRNGYSYALLMKTVWDSTEDRETIREAWKTLHEIADHPSAGSISWEMRRFIRRALPELLPEFFWVVRERARIIKDYCFINTDEVFFGSENPCDYLERAKRNLEREKQPKEPDYQI